MWHFYHAWTGGDWQDIVTEHQQCLKDSGFEGEVLVNEVARGFEDVTLNLLREFCLDAAPETPVLYAHAKGSFRKVHLRNKITQEVYEPDISTYWRQGMDDRLVRCWRARVKDLETYDLVGCHWIEPPEAERSYFAGNFWWARAGYIATLPPLPELDGTNRWEAEGWVARGHPRVKALSEGFVSIPFPPTPEKVIEVEYVEF